MRPIILDVYGVVYTGSINTSLIAISDQYRKAGHPVYLASNVSADKASYFLDELNLRNHVDRMFTSGGIGAAKPAPLFYHTVTQKIRANPDDILFFDDSIRNVDGANDYGWNAHHYTNIESAQLILTKILGNP